MEKLVVLTQYKPGILPGKIMKEKIIDFLYHHLDQYGDAKMDIEKCIDYALSSDNGKGGFVITATINNELVGATVINDTGMEGYIPENILVYIAVDNTKRGLGIGKKLMRSAMLEANGAIALHVEPDNPARLLYEKLGFTSKYLEMRYYPN